MQLGIIYSGGPNNIHTMKGYNIFTLKYNFNNV